MLGAPQPGCSRARSGDLLSPPPPGTSLQVQMFAALDTHIRVSAPRKQAWPAAARLSPRVPAPGRARALRRQHARRVDARAAILAAQAGGVHQGKSHAGLLAALLLPARRGKLCGLQARCRLSGSSVHLVRCLAGEPLQEPRRPHCGAAHQLPHTLVRPAPAKHRRRRRGRSAPQPARPLIMHVLLLQTSPS